MESKFYKKAMKIIHRTNRDTALRVDGGMIYLQEAQPQVLKALLDSNFGLALSCGEVQILQELDSKRDITKY